MLKIITHDPWHISDVSMWQELDVFGQVVVDTDCTECDKDRCRPDQKQKFYMHTRTIITFLILKLYTYAFKAHKNLCNILIFLIQSWKCLFVSFYTQIRKP